MNKLILFFSFLLLLSTSVLAAECVVGIDDYCDPNCIPVDFDCPQNPYVNQQDVDCKTEADGRCDENCLDSDWDCLTINHEDQQRKNTYEVLVEEEPYLVPPSQATQPDTSISFIATFEDTDELSTTQIILIIGGVVFLLVIIIFIFYHYKAKQTTDAYSGLRVYAQAALEKGYTLEQIRQSLRSQNYDESFINGFLKSLEP